MTSSSLLIGLLASVSSAAEIGRSDVYSVIEIAFEGPTIKASDVPARDMTFQVLFSHESAYPQYVMHGFWDGDGKGGFAGNVFKVRFCPTRPGRWNLMRVHSSRDELRGQHQGDYVTAVASDRHGFWEPDTENAGGRWYGRSDGSHQYVFGNTHYSFLSGYRDGGELKKATIEADVAANARYFKKLRFGVQGDRYPHPTDKPFLDDEGRPTDRGDFSHRPNPKWFRERVDVAVATAFDHDLIADLILAGPDTEDSRATLRASENGGGVTPYLRYLAARYGSYPNVWFCLCNEYDIKAPKYPEDEVAAFGQKLRSHLPYPTPVSVHAAPPTWPKGLDRWNDWNDHQIVQNKIRKLGKSADVTSDVWKNAGGAPRERPTVNDELSYEGDGDRHSEHDTIESHLGAFLGGGYASTGEKYGNKLGQYFWGDFDADAHKAVDNLGWLRGVIDERITFWKMSPGHEVFENLDDGFRGLAWEGREYALGTNKAKHGIVARLPEGTWTVTRHDVIAMKSDVLSDDATGRFEFESPESRSALFHFRKNGE